MRFGRIGLVLLALAGCAQTTAPVTSPYMNQRLEFQAEVVNRPLDVEFKLFINGNPVVQAISEPTTRSRIAFEGLWRGQKVFVDLRRDINVLTTSNEIDIYISGNLVETLRL